MYADVEEYCGKDLYMIKRSATIRLVLVAPGSVQLTAVDFDNIDDDGIGGDDDTHMMRFLCNVWINCG